MGIGVITEIKRRRKIIGTLKTITCSRIVITKSLRRTKTERCLSLKLL
jgi:hypothetical protein